MMINGACVKRPYDCDIRFVDPTSGEPLGEQTLRVVCNVGGRLR